MPNAQAENPRVECGEIFLQYSTRNTAAPKRVKASLASTLQDTPVRTFMFHSEMFNPDDPTSLRHR